MNPGNVTYTSYPNTDDPNINHSNSHSFSHGRHTPRANTSNMSYSPQTNLATMAGTPIYHAYTPSLATGMNVGVAGTAGPGSTLQRSATRNSYLSYASTPSWVNPSTMIETSTPATRTSRPLPDPQRFSSSRYMSPQPGQQGDYGGMTGGGGGYRGQQADYGYAGPGLRYGHQLQHQQGRPASGGLYITNVTEEEEEEVEGGEGSGEEGYVDVPPPAHPHPHQQLNTRPQNGYNSVPNIGYSMPIGMMGPNGLGVPMERVAPPNPNQYPGRPLPVPGAQQPLGRRGTIESLKWKKKKDKTPLSPSPSFVGGFFVGLKSLPKRVLRYGKKKPVMEEEGDEEFGNLRNFDDMLPGYASHPATPTGVRGNIRNPPIPAEQENRMPGEMPTEPPPPQRLRNPNLKLTRPSGETLRQGLNTADQEFFDHSDVHGNQPSPSPPPPAVEYPVPSTERGRTAIMMYHDKEEESNTPPAGRSGSTLSRRGSSVRVRTPTPTPAIDTTVSPPANVQSPDTAHPQPANDYLKMTASPRTAGTQVTSFSTDPSFASDLNPVFRFFAGFYQLPWFSERSTVDYSPFTGFGGKNGGRGGTGKKSNQSWYRKKGDIAGLSASLSLDLLSSGEGDRDGDDRASVISPLGGWRRRGMRRNNVDRVGGGGGGRHGHRIRDDTRHGHGHGHGHRRGHGHGHGHGHGGGVNNGRVRGRRYRRRSMSTITFEEYHHQRNISPMVPSTYPYPFVSPPFPYFAYPPPAGPTPPDANTVNQGMPGAMDGGEEGTRKDETSEQHGQTGPRGPRHHTSHGHQGRSGGGPILAPGYTPSPSMYPAPVWYGDGVEQRRVVYMPMTVPLPL